MERYLEYPKLRWPLDLRLERVQGQEVLLVRCPLGISTTPLLLVPAVGPILSCFEGNLSLDQIAERFAQYKVERSLVEKLADMLDQHLFLVSPRFYEAERNIKEHFSGATVRDAALAGLGYSASAKDLELELTQYLSHNGTNHDEVLGPMVGLVAPHIDYRRGKECYGVTYNNLRHEQHDTYILLGTSHQYSRRLFHLTSKDFASPLGLLPCDKGFVERLAQLYGSDRSFADEILHRREHSLELQLPFLRHLKRDFKIVPILVGGFHHFLASDKPPEENGEYNEFVAALAEAMSERMSNGERVCVLAGVDMAHVGRAFGDVGSLTDTRMNEIKARDEVYLNSLLKQDKRMLIEHIAEDSDARRICGYPTMYTVLDLFDRLSIRYKAKLFDYRQNVDYESDCAVTFAGLGMYKA